MKEISPIEVLRQVRKVLDLLYRLATHETIIQEYSRLFRESQQYHPGTGYITTPQAPGRFSRSMKAIDRFIDRFLPSDHKH